jgi:hypothetical protein
VEQVIRPTGLVDPNVRIEPARGQVPALLGEVRARAEKGELTDPEVGTPISAEMLRDTVFGGMYDPAAWPGLAKQLASYSKAGAPSKRAIQPFENSYQAIWCEDWKWNTRDVRQLNRKTEQLTLSLTFQLSLFSGDY